MSHLIFTTLERNLARLKLSSQASVNYNLKLNQKLPYVECIRSYRPRKPFWLPTAKSKIFRIPKKPEIPKDESVELERLIRVYRTQMKSLQLHFKEQLMAQTTGPEVLEERKRKAMEQHAECIKMNEQWNAEVAKLREERLAKEAVAREEKIMQKMIAHDKQQLELISEIDARIREEKEAAKTYITAENIDEAIEMALNNVVDHNFAIDLEGNRYEGRYGRPSKTSKKTTPELLLEQDKSKMAEASN